MAHVLVVDDEVDNLVLFRRILESRGYSVTTANDGMAAVAAAQQQQPQLILMDMSMPVMDGWEATVRLKADPTTAAIPVLALTANVLERDYDRAMAAGCAAYIRKPIELHQFLRVVAQHVLDDMPAT